MRSFFFLITYILLLSQIYCQNSKIVEWIDNTSIKIEDVNPNTELVIFNENIPKNFENAKIFGFGEATHHGKEFFDIKAKFFKYLVKKLDVKVFIIEDSYTSEAGINEWINGGEGSKQTIANNFSIAPWYCKEIVSLLEWIRDYNSNKSEYDKIRFYGMDIQNVKGINTQIRDLVYNYNIPVSEELLLIVDSCVTKKVTYNKISDWADIQMPKLNEIKDNIAGFQEKFNKNKKTIAEFKSVLRGLEYLIKYTYYVQNNYSQDRDLKMFENIKWILEHKSNNGKAFIWAHNEHINNNGFANYSKRSIYNLGRHLKAYYKEDYFSVGFDFGKGQLLGYNFDKESNQMKWKIHQLHTTHETTYAKTFIKTKNDVYFINMSAALKSDYSFFFKKKQQQMVLGDSGYKLEQNNLYKKKLSKMYDGLIFVKTINVPDYNINTVSK